MPQTSTYHSPPGFRIIGAFKLIGALIMFGAAVGVYRMAGGDVGATLEDLATTWRIDPHNRVIHDAISRVTRVEPARLRAIGVGTFVYATLYAAEGLGLVLGTLWGGYLTVVVTGFFVPLEVWEVYQKPGAKRVAVLVVNLAILAYVVAKLVQERRAMRGNPPQRTQMDTERKIN